jgi:predicted amidohydrolase YtcJ
MNIQKSLFLLFIGVSFFLLNIACNKDTTNNDQTDCADLVLHNGKIYTVNQTQKWAEAIAISEGEIIYVGNDEGMDEFIGDNTKVEDLGGKMVMPGIHDVHQHPLEAMSPLGVCFLSNEEEDAEKFIGEVSGCRHEKPSGVDFLFGGGHSIFTILEAERPPVDILDDAIEDIPVLIMEETSHSMWVNSKALEIAGIDANTPNPSGGVISKDEITGKPDGLLLDGAGDFLIDAF